VQLHAALAAADRAARILLQCLQHVQAQQLVAVEQRAERRALDRDAEELAALVLWQAEDCSSSLRVPLEHRRAEG
jgi:hypothetical protein